MYGPLTTDDIPNIPTLDLCRQFLREVLLVDIELDAPGHVLDDDERPAPRHHPPRHTGPLTQGLQLFLGLVTEPVLQLRGQRIAPKLVGKGRAVLADCRKLFAAHGDIVGGEGPVHKSGKGDLYVYLDNAALLTKALRPLPEKWHGLSDQEQRYRQRYVDLIVNEDVRNTFILRSRIIEYIRRYFVDAGFLEVETPMMQVIPGGATAAPFITHHKALDMALYLRIAPELYLKRLVVGRFEKVFEINRNFRNEGLSTRHNPEFTMIEFYEAYVDYHHLMDRTEELTRGIAVDLLGSPQVEYQGETYHFGEPFARMTVKEAILRFNPELAADDLDDFDKAVAHAQRLGIEIKPTYGLGKVQIEIFEKTVEHELKDPTFITAYPTEVSPLARRNDADPTVTDRFEFFVGGREIANGFSELNDPEDQAERFRRQVEEKEAGDDEAMHFDADYVRALEHGLPPTAGEGIGIDRLVMLFTDSPSIRDVLLFPHMRPEG